MTENTHINIYIMLQKYYIEKINVSDDSYLITMLGINDIFIEKGSILFSYESSKTSYDCISEISGWLYMNPDVKKDESHNYGTLVAVVSNEKLTNSELNEIFLFKRGVIPENNHNTNVAFTNKAKALIERYNIDLSVFETETLVTEDVVEMYVNSTIQSKIKEAYNDIIVIGGKGGAKMVIETIRSLNMYSIKGIVDSTMKIGERVFDVEVIGGDEIFDNLLEDGYSNIVLSFTSLSNLEIREKKYLELKEKGFRFPNIIHRTATVEPSVKMGEGNIILANSMLGSDLSLGDMNFINTGAILSHDTNVGRNNHFAPNAVVAGRVKIGNNNLFGMCSTTYFDVTIGKNNIINNGINVFMNIGDGKILK